MSYYKGIGDVLKIYTLVGKMFLITNQTIFFKTYTNSEWEWEMMKRMRLIDLIKSRYQSSQAVAKLHEYEFAELRDIIYQ